MADTNITADPILISLSIKYLLSRYPSHGRDTSLDQVFDCTDVDSAGNADGGIPEISVSLIGTWLNKVFAGVSNDAIISIPVTLTASHAEGVHISSSTVISISVTVVPDDTDVVFESKMNWVSWSNIGVLDFTIGNDNIAGERPMDWKGWVRGLLMLGQRVVSYGKNGVSFLTPVENRYKLRTIHRIGTKGKHAFAGNDDIHLFIDAENRLYRITEGEGLEKLDYSEYLSALSSSVVMTLDKEANLVYICDGTYGFVYSIEDNSLGAGPVNITGMGSQDGTLYPVAPATIVTPTFEICTDIYDLGSRNNKTIQSVEFGTDANTENQILYAAIEYRKNRQDAFASKDWKIVHESGVLWQTTFGREFRFKFKLALYEYVELDYIRVKGVIHEN